VVCKEGLDKLKSAINHLESCLSAQNGSTNKIKISNEEKLLLSTRGNSELTKISTVEETYNSQLGSAPKPGSLTARLKQETNTALIPMPNLDSSISSIHSDESDADKTENKDVQLTGYSVDIAKWQKKMQLKKREQRTNSKKLLRIIAKSTAHLTRPYSTLLEACLPAQKVEEFKVILV